MVVMMMMSLCIRSEYLLIKVTSDFFFVPGISNCCLFSSISWIFINLQNARKHFDDAGESNSCTCFFNT